MAFFGFKQNNTAMSSMIQKLKAAGEIEPFEAEPVQPTVQPTAAAPATADDAGQASEASAIQS